MKRVVLPLTDAQRKASVVFSSVFCNDLSEVLPGKVISTCDKAQAIELEKHLTEDEDFFSPLWAYDIVRK